MLVFSGHTLDVKLELVGLEAMARDRCVTRISC
jgi:hypothetical protein